MQPLDITPNTNHASVDRWWGFSFEEDAGASAYVRFRKGSVSGTIVWRLRLAANESASIVLPEAMSTEDGLYIEEVSGSVAGTVFLD